MKSIARTNGFYVLLIRTGLASLAVGAMISLGPAQVINVPPAPEWIQSVDAETNRPIFIRKAFEAPPRLLKAILLGACEGQMTVSVNGHEAASISGREQAASVDITRLVQPGTNLIAVQALSSNALPLVSLLIEVNGDLSQRKWIASDSTWLAAVVEQPGWKQPAFNPRGWNPARSLRRTDEQGAANPFDVNKAFDAYNSWKLALAGKSATDAAALTLLPGFKAELVRSAGPDEDSWVAMAFDPQGRLTLAREQRGLLRLNLDSNRISKTEVINDSLLECRGLLYTRDALFANANNSKALFRLRDPDGDGRFDETVEVLRTGGGVGHGRNHMKLGPDGWIYIAHGNNVLLPTTAATNSPLKRYTDHRLIPCPWDRSMFDGDVEWPAGHILRLNPDRLPATAEVFAGGFRNPMDIAFNQDGELFTFDADMEWDLGAPWYMPNRVLHVVSGGDFGWRRGTGRFPQHYADTLPSTLDFGLASPTGVIFGYGSQFPAKYQEAFYILDWAYGRILAVHLQPDGASYRATSELFISGRPLNVTDACIGPDGALWFITGGRKTQSGLYRVTYAGPESVATEKGADKGAASVRALRKKLETFHHGVETGRRREVVATLWPHLGHSDRRVRYAARVALENIEPAEWQVQALREPEPAPALTALLALVRVNGTNAHRLILERLNQLTLTGLSDESTLAALRVYALALARLGKPEDALRSACLTRLDPLYPAAAWQVNHELCELLVYLNSPDIITRTLALLQSSNRSEDLLQYLFYLRYVRTGWSIDQRRQFFEALARAESMPGARQYVTALSAIRREVIYRMSPAERETLKALLPGPNEAPAAVTPTGPIVKEWRLEDFSTLLERVAHGRSFASGKAAVVSAQCVACHRVSQDASLPAGLTGPDLTSVASRFNRHDLLDHILNPSKVIDEKFRNITLTLNDGIELTGAIEGEDDKNITIRPNPLAGQPTVVARGSIRERSISNVSPMAEGLLNHLQSGQILDLLAFLECGGDPNAAAFKLPVATNAR